MPRFVILRHEYSPDSSQRSHWDMMFEQGDVLFTWACQQLPDRGTSVEASQLADHRLAYLDYEGPVSGERGSVSQWDQGEYQVIERSPARWDVELQGEKLAGRLTLTRQERVQAPWQAVYSPAASDV